MITQGNVPTMPPPMPAGARCIVAKTGDVSVDVGSAMPEFRALGRAAREAALEKIMSLNPHIRRRRFVDGNMKKGPWEFTVNYTIDPGRHILLAY